RMTEGRDDLDFRSKWATTCDDMMRHLNELRPAIIHLSGRGSSMNSGHSVSAPHCLDPRGLKMMVEAAATSVRVAVLDACYSAEHADELHTVVDCVVGMTGAIGDAAARSYAVAFYRALGNRRSVGNAVDQATAVLAARRIPDEHF